MGKNKKLLLFLALNSLATSFAGVTTGKIETKYDKLYTNMTKNMETGKSNEKNYKLIEDVLNKRNKELKDLSLQGDYIVKPEYLEWQIFFSGFYNHSNRGGSVKEISSVPEISGKVIDLGVVIPVKGRQIQEVGLNLSSPSKPEVNVNIETITAPVINDLNFNFVPALFPEKINLKPTLTNTFPGEDFISPGKNTQNVQFNTSGDSSFENLNVTALGKTKLEVNDAVLQVTGAVSYDNGLVTGITPVAYNHGVVPDLYSAINIGTNGNFTVDGDWELYSTRSTDYNVRGLGFISYRPYYITSDSKVDFLGNLELTGNTGFTAKTGLFLDLQNQTSLPNVKATLENKGVVTLTGQSMTAMQLNPGTKNGTVSGELINSGTINLNNSVEHFNYHATGIQIPMPPTESGQAIVKIGNINVNGPTNDGVYVRSSVYSNVYTEVPSNVIIDGSNGIIVLNGYRNTGITLTRAMASPGSSNGLGNLKNLNILVNGSAGVGINVTPSELNLTKDYILTDSMVQSIAFGPNSKSSTLFGGGIYQNGKALVLDQSLRNSMGIIDTGTMNTVVSVISTGRVINNIPIEISENAKATYAFASMRVLPYGFYDNGTIINNADIINNSSPSVETVWPNPARVYGGMGIGALSNGVTTINKGSITMGGESSIGLYNEGIADSESDHIIVNNNKGVAVYGSYGEVTMSPSHIASTTRLKANSLEVNGENGVVLYSKAGNIELSPLVAGNSLEITANGNSTYAFFMKLRLKEQLLQKENLQYMTK